MTAINSYAIRDLFPGVLEQKPDLVLIYAGHNEYYGALGIGSMESLGTSREFVNLLLYLNKYKTVEFLRNTIQWVFKLFTEDEEKPSGTMMSRMAQDQYIELGSETYEAGISQFEGNIRDVLNMAKKKNIPVILSTLASNLKDQQPFISVKSDMNPGADDVYAQANEEFNKNNYQTADSLFRFAKDLDGLRFRAPEKLNQVIKSLSQEYNLALVDLDSSLSIMSPNGIIGNNMMTDHLHPTLDGQLILGRLFYEKMSHSNFLPEAKSINISDTEQDSITVKNFHFTSLDSTIADFRIKLLKNDWPFVDKDNKKPNSVVLKLITTNDTLAAEVLDDKISWEESHRKMAAHYLVNKDVNSFLEEMDALISQYTVVVEYYDYVANVLIQIKDYKRAQKYLYSGYEIKPSAFKAKWLGTIDLYNNKLESAEKYLNESLKYDAKDSQVWYNLAGIYVKKNEYDKALELVNKALSLKSNYPEAVNLQSQLQNRILQKK
jgi:tetratricopeptide (TPR) repeat protein